MDEKRKASYEARGIKVRSGTQEEADALGILIHPVNVSRTPKTADTGRGANKRSEKWRKH